jgi:hypothetical protein
VTSSSQTPLSSKRRPLFKTSKFLEEKKYGHGVSTGSESRMTVLARASSLPYPTYPTLDSHLVSSRVTLHDLRI